MMKKFWSNLRLTIRTKLMVIVSTVAILSMGILTYIAISIFSDRTTVLIQGLSYNSNKLLNGKVDTELTAKIEAIALADKLQRSGGTAATNAMQQTLLNKESDILFIQALRKNPYQPGSLVPLYTLANSSGLVSLKMTPAGLSDKLKDLHKRFITSFQNEVFIKNISPLLTEPGFVLVLPHRQSEQVASHIVVAVVRAQALDKVFIDEDITTSFILDNEGDIIIHKDRKVTESVRSFKEHPAYDLVKSAKLKAEFRKVEVAGEETFISYSSLERYNLSLLTTISAEIALETVSIVRVRAFLIAIIILLIAILVIYFYAKSMSEPIKALADASERIKQGDYSLQLKASANDEIGDLTESFNTMAVGLEEREQLKGALGKFVNPEIAEKAMRGELTLGGERRNAAIFFSDIRSFTAISEKLEPEQVVEFLNEYMTLMVDIINRTGGVVDKFIGDAIMAVWGVPTSKGNDLENCINACLMMREALIGFNEKRGTEEKPLIKIGCGVNYGPVLAGQIGSEDRLEYTVIGDAVNLASRIESLNKPFATDILISEYAYQQVQETFHCVPTQRIRVKGKAEPQKIFAVLGRKDDPDAPADIHEMRQRVGIRVPDKKEKAKNPEKKYEAVSK